MFIVIISTCWDVHICDLYLVCNADGATNVVQTGPQLIYYHNIWDIQVNRNQVFIHNWRSCRGTKWKNNYTLTHFERKTEAKINWIIGKQGFLGGIKIGFTCWRWSCCQRTHRKVCGYKDVFRKKVTKYGHFSENKHYEEKGENKLTENKTKQNKYLQTTIKQMRIQLYQAENCLKKYI